MVNHDVRDVEVGPGASHRIAQCVHDDDIVIYILIGG